MPNRAYLFLFLAVVFNLITIWCMEPSKRLTRPGYTIGLFGAICATQALITLATSEGVDTGPAITIVVVLVMIGSAVFGYVQKSEIPSLGQWVGYAVAVIGVLVVSFAKKIGF
jgi:drug/metabolite transporter (DMT)-like permease